MAEKEKKTFNLRCRLTLKAKAHHDSTKKSCLKVKSVKKTSTEACKQWLENLKQKSEQYKQFRTYETLRRKVWRSNLTGKKKDEQREKTRIRVARKRARDKAQQLSTSQCNKPPKTRAKVEKQREIWKEAQKRCRVKKTPQQKRRHNEKRCAKYAEKRLKEKAALRTPKDQDPGSSTSFGTTNALKQAAKRVRQKIPSSSEKAVEIIEYLITNATPKSKAMLKTRSIISPSSKKHLAFLEEATCTSRLKNTMANLQKKRGKVAMQQKQVLTAAASAKKKYIRQQRKILGFGYKTIKKMAVSETPGELDPRKRRSDALDLDTLKLVENFYNRGDIARALPDARSAKKNGNSIVGRRVMERSISSAHEQFMAEHPGIKLGVSAFGKLRPKHIATMDNNKREACLCEYCINIDFKLQALTRFCSIHSLGQCIIKDRYDASKRTMCPKEEGANPLKKCLDRQCTSCGTDKLDQHLQPLMAAHGDANNTWLRWQMDNVRYGDKIVRRMVKVRKAGSVQQMVNELKKELEPSANHLFNAYWQWKKYNDICQNLPENWVVFCSDFGENYTCQDQDEAQGAHWSNVQSTVHPIVATYKCQVPDCTMLITDTIMFISNDIKHCYHGVQHFTSLAIKCLQDEGIPIGKLVHYSDGALTQYKCKVNFCDASFSIEDFGFTTERHYFGSRHGKGPCDREIGVLKKQFGLDIKARLVEVGNAKELFEYGVKRLTRPKQEIHVHCKRRFIFVKYGDIQRDRPARTRVKLLKGTMKLHSIRGIRPYVVASRERSCFCEACTNNTGECPNADITGTWVESDLSMATEPRAPEADPRTPEVERQAPEAERQAPEAERQAPEAECQAPEVITDEVVASDIVPSEVTWHVGEWVLVEYDNVHYPGCVLNIIGSESLVDCMEPTGAYWKWPKGWPDHKDTTWYTHDKIVRMLSPPVPASATRGQISKFLDM